MTREEEIKQAANALFDIPFENNTASVLFGFEEGARWADSHPKNPWRDAQKDPPKESNENTRYFVRDMWGVSRAASYDDMDKEWSDIYGDELIGITHWMPIPELEGGEK